MAPLAPGRTARMDLHAVARSGIEGCGRALAAGVIGPVFWYLLFGFPGLLVFKLLSVMDLVVGHRTARHRASGFARSEEHTSELQSQAYPVCCLLLEKKNILLISV